MAALKVDDALQAIATLQQENTKLLVALIDLHRHTTAYLTAGGKTEEAAHLQLMRTMSETRMLITRAGAVP